MYFFIDAPTRSHLIFLAIMVIQATKGQLISKADMKIFIWTKKPNENIFVCLT